MKKMLILINDNFLPADVLRFAFNIAKQENSVLFGIFAQHPGDIDRGSSFAAAPKDMHRGSTVTDDTRHEALQTTIKSFLDLCAAENIACETHIVSNKFIETLTDHSAFADVMICDADYLPVEYSLNTLLANAHCPVVMVNKGYERVDTLVLAYDDLSSSIYAIKQFTYLFGFYKHLPAQLVSVIPDNVLGIEYADLIKEWLPLHYSSASIKILKGETKAELSKFINSLENPLVVMGAFGRSPLSRFFKDSLANHVLEQTTAPLFITHE